MAVASLIGTPFHPRTGALNRNQRWREWAGYLAADRYADHHDIEYNAIREAAAMIDVSPLYKYLVTGPDAERLVDRVIVRDATRLRVGRVYYTCWCDEAGKVLDDGTVCRLDETRFRWTAAEPNLRWLRMNARGLDVAIEDISERVAALALQGPLSREVLQAVTGSTFGDLRYFRERGAEIAGIPVDVTRTGYTGDLGFEIWMDADRAPDVWDAVATAGEGYGARPCGLDAMDVARIEAGLILLDVDYTSARSALIPEQTYSPDELGILGRFVTLDKGAEFVGRRALERERAAGGPARRLVGLEVAWEGIEARYEARGLFPVLEATTSRAAVPVFAGGRQVGKVTSATWSPLLKRYIALASVEAAYEAPGTRLEVEWTVEARRGRAGAVVVPLPFFDPPRKRSVAG
ncbi:MAG TPA: aminomethyltransferase family protein [Actinomycetota bacterium]|nr:aminomethyltransferase family protein [Actinomycetota bacterium]